MSIHDTSRFAAEIFQLGLEFSSPCIIALEGEIGVGKSELVRQGLKSLGFHDAVQSPTFTIYNEYKINGVAVVHADFYRLSDPDDLLMIGWDEVIDSANIVFVEWASTVNLSADIEISIVQDGDARIVEVKRNQ